LPAPFGPARTQRKGSGVVNGDGGERGA